MTAAPPDAQIGRLLDGLEELTPEQYKTFLAHALAAGARLNVFDYPPDQWPPPTPARAYIAAFLERYRDQVAGRCVEFYPPVYRNLFAANPGVTAYDVWNVAAAPGVSVVADLQDAAALPDGRFDTIICTHVLSAIADAAAAAAELHRLLSPGGMLLLTVPCVLQKYAPDPQDFWRYTRDSVQRLLAGFSRVEMHSLGNASTVAGAPFYLMTHHFPAGEVHRNDPECPSIIVAAAWK